MPSPASPLTLAYLAEIQSRHQRELTDALKMCAANDDVDVSTAPHSLNERGEWVAVVKIEPSA